MRETILRIRTFCEFQNKFIDNPKLVYDSPKVVYKDYAGLKITHYSGVNDSKGNLIFEGDIIKLCGKENVEPYIGVVCMQRYGLNEKEFTLCPAWKVDKSDNTEIISDTQYFILIETPTIGENRIRGHFTNNDYPINKENGTGFTDGTISEVIGNIFENKEIIPLTNIPYYSEINQ